MVHSPELPGIPLSCVALTLNTSVRDKLPIKSGKITAQDFDVQLPLIDAFVNTGDFFLLKKRSAADFFKTNCIQLNSAYCL